MKLLKRNFITKYFSKKINLCSLNVNYGFTLSFRVRHIYASNSFIAIFPFPPLTALFPPLIHFPTPIHHWCLPLHTCYCSFTLKFKPINTPLHWRGEGGEVYEKTTLSLMLDSDSQGIRIQNNSLQ